ncbi:MAG: NHL repeat-containing protein, partial [Anaerolineales bacterium]|nr:NHL repeat-containing protein [Anaerolineales bacterium]
MKISASRIWLVLAILSITTLSCKFIFGNGDDEGLAPQMLAEDEVQSAHLGDEYRSVEGGYAFNVVSGYGLEESFGLVSMQPPDADPDVGPFFILIGGLNEETRSSPQLLDDFVSGLGQGGEIMDQREVPIDGIPGIAVGFKGLTEGKEAVGRAAFVAVTPTQMFSLVVVAPPDLWNEGLASTFEAVLATITFYEPQAEPAELDQPEPVEVAETPAQEVIRQWASSAAASSEYSSPDWSADQATGAPDTPDCGDLETAWASLEGDGVDWLEVRYDIPVIPTEVNIYESHTPSQVVKVELVDSSGSYHEIYNAIPEMMGDCPFVLSVQVDSADYLAVAVKITIDQSIIDLPWDEVDAVELVGLVQSGSASVEVETTVEAPPAGVPVGEITMPDSTLWRVSEGSLGIELGTFGDIAVSGDNRIYVPDNGNGVFIFDADGNQLDLIDHDDLQNPVDVKVGPDGNIYVADYFADAILIFTPDGEFISKFGESGNGPGQFGSFGPKALAVCPDNTIYALDDNRDENDDPFVRLIIFTKDGQVLGEMPIDEGFPVGMDCGADGYLYVVNYFGNNIQKRDKDGNIIAEVGGEALQGMDPQYITFDKSGYMYLTVWNEPGVVILDPAG